MEIVGSEPEAVLVCAILRDAGIRCMHRVTNLGSGAMDGLTIGGPREIVVHRDQLERARSVVGDQRDRPRPPSGGDTAPGEPPSLVPAVATHSVPGAEDALTGDGVLLPI